MRQLKVLLVLAAAVAQSLSAAAQVPTSTHAGSCPNDHARNRAKVSKFFASAAAGGGQVPGLGRLELESVRLLDQDFDKQVCRQLNRLLGDYTSSDWILSYYAVDEFYIAVVSRQSGAAKLRGEFDPLIFFDSTLKPLVAFSS